MPDAARAPRTLRATPEVTGPEGSFELETPGDEAQVFEDGPWCDEDGPYGYVCSRPKGHDFDPDHGEPHAGFTSGGMLVVWPKPFGQPGVSIKGKAWQEKLHIRQVVEAAEAKEERPL